PNQFQALRKSFIPERPVPVMVTRLFELPVQISLGVYSLERPANPQPIAYLVLQADSFRMYKFVMSTLSTLVTIYLLLSLILTVAISWCINRLILHPLRNIARELNAIPAQELVGHQLALPRLHQDDEIGMLVRSYNLNQQLLQRHYEEQNENAMRFPVSDLPNKALLMEMLEQVVARKQTTALMIITCETLRDTAGVLKEAQREILLLTLVEKLKSVLSPRMILAQISGYDFAVIANGVPVLYRALTAEQLYSRAISAAFTARHKGKNQIQFFDPQQMEAAQKRLTEESDILNALENHQFAIWLQPQVEMTSGKLVSAEVLLRIQQPDGSWDLPDGLIDRIECCGLMVTVGHWVLEESCRLLAAWQERGIMLPLSVNLSALQLMHPNMVADMLE
ncbi:EAL domain-containing protein, partial [Escherichia marmotae]|nr:EAL domain-containing protein [Escherichia marmotae]